MAAITSDEDAEFVASVGGFMMTNFQALQKDVENQIEEYLRRRITILSETHHSEIEGLRHSHDEIVQGKDLEIAELDKKIDKMKKHLNGLAAYLAHTRELCFIKQCWHTWIRFAAVSKERKKVAAAMEVNTLRRLTSSRWSAWRMFTALQSQHKRHEVLLRSREKKLSAEMNTLKDQLAKQEVTHNAATEQTRTAFVRGICALNREAVQVLRGETGEEEAEAIESILRGGTTTPSVRSGQSSSNHAGAPGGAGYRSPDELGRGNTLETYGYGGASGSAPISPSSTREQAAAAATALGGKGFQQRREGDDWQRTHPHGANSTTTTPLIRGDGHSSTMSGAQGCCPRHAASGTTSRHRHSPIPPHYYVEGDKPVESGICPVHHVDYDGNFYHKCYNPILSSARGSPPPSTHTPFVVRVDPNEGMPLGALPLKRKK